MTENQTVNFKAIAILAAKLADEKKGENIIIYDMAGRSDLADFVLVITTDNPAHLEAVEEDIAIKLKQENMYAIYKDGMKSKNWKVLDYGGILVHIFEKEARVYYALDKVFDGYSKVKWQPRPEPAPVAKKTVKKVQETAKKAVQKAKPAKKAAKPVKKAAKTVKKAVKKAVKKTVKKTAKKKK